MRKSAFFIFFFFIAICGFSQIEEDSTSRVATPRDLANPQVPIADTTAVDSLAFSSIDSTALDSLKPAEPLFDFRTEPDAFLHGLYHDSTLIIGSRYTSYGDIFDWIPGGYYFNRGGAGQLSYGSMFGAPAGEMVLEYDGLNLANPLTGFADFNLVATESMGHAGVIHSSYKPYGYMPIGHSLHFKSRTIADNPIRSQIGYRTGYYQYDDVDVRVGIKASEKFSIDFGGVIRNYGGLTSNEGYSGTKVNAKLNRRFGSNWLLRYVALFSLRDAEIPLPGSLEDLQQFLDPKQKDRRVDHGLILQHKSNFSTSLQYTKFERELRAADKSVFFEQNETHSLRGTAELNIPLGSIRWRNGLHGWATRAESNNWGKRGDWQLDAYSSLNGRAIKQLKWHVSLKAEKNEAFTPQLLPEANLFFSIDSTAGASIWANRIVYYPSIMARYTIGPFAYGNLDLSHAAYQQLGIAGEKQFPNIFIHASAAFMQRTNQIATYYDGESVLYSNMPSHSTLTFDTQIDYCFMTKWRFVFKGNLFSDLGADPLVTQRPNLYGKAFFQYHLLAFKGDLNAQLRVGAFVLGERQGPVPFYSDYSISTKTLGAAIYPYLHAVLHFGSAEIFFAYENYIDADVQYVYGYSMPQMWFRYGFIWHFID